MYEILLMVSKGLSSTTSNVAIISHSTVQLLFCCFELVILFLKNHYFSFVIFLIILSIFEIIFSPLELVVVSLLVVGTHFVVGGNL